MRCVVNHCEHAVHAGGYCRRHYGQVWRNGRIDEPASERNPAALPKSEQLNACQRELAQTRIIYERACGLQRRLELRRQLTELEADLARIKALPAHESLEPVKLGGRGNRNSPVTDQRLKDLRALGLSHAEIGRRVGLSAVRVGQRLRELGSGRMRESERGTWGRRPRAVPAVPKGE